MAAPRRCSTTDVSPRRRRRNGQGDGRRDGRWVPAMPICIDGTFSSLPPTTSIPDRHLTQEHFSPFPILLYFQRSEDAESKDGDFRTPKLSAVSNYTGCRQKKNARLS